MKPRILLRESAQIQYATNMGSAHVPVGCTLRKYIHTVFQLQIHHRVRACFVPLKRSTSLEHKLSDAFWV